MLHLLFGCGLSVALAACPSTCYSCSVDGTTCLSPDGRTWSQVGPYDRFCKDGFYGQTCSAKCPTNCAQAYCSSAGYCMATPTRTDKSDAGSANPYDRAIYCKDGFTGGTCGSVCPVNCARSYCSASGYCMANATRIPGSDFDSAGNFDRAIFCRDGFSGSTCAYRCPANCAQPYCSSNGYCMATPTRTDKSDSGSAGPYDRAIYCQDGFTGGTCGTSCPLNCAMKYCSASGYCMATSPRTPGSDFDSAGMYDRAIFCKDGFSGITCAYRCPVNCAQAYCSSNGYCMATPTRTDKSDAGSANPYDRAIYCKDGFTGGTCANVCPVNCVRSYCSAGGYCMANATRIPGSDFDSAGTFDRAVFCKDGFSGSTCAARCPTNCAQPYCSSNGYCMATPVRTDKSDSGSANPYDRAIYCKDGFTGGLCGSACPANCALRFCSAGGFCMATSLRMPGSDFDSAGNFDRAIFCRDGYFGSTCALRCPTGCAQPYCSSNGYCMATPTRTSRSDFDSANIYDRASFCKNGFSGSTCGTACSTKCGQPWCSAGGYCMACAVRTPLGDFGSSGAYDRAHFCNDGFYGSTCSNSCPANCAQTWCSAGGYCMAQAERVPKGDPDSATCSDPAIFCKTGWSGSVCGNACPSACSRNCSACGGCDIVPSPTPVNPYPRLACTQPTPVPAACSAEMGQCSWYGDCLKLATPNSCPDITAVMQAKCSLYQALESALSPDGKKWSQTLRGCLQNQLSQLWAANTYGTVPCEVIQSEFFNNTLPCYMNGAASFCTLPTMDTLKILLNASSVLVSNPWWVPLPSGAQLQARCTASYFQVNAVRRPSADSLEQADIESDLRQFFQSWFKPQGWSVDITTIKPDQVLALGFLPTVPSNPPLAGLAPYFVEDALRAWAKTSTGSYYQVSINDGPPLATPELKSALAAADETTAFVLPITIAFAAFLVVVAVALLIPRKKQALLADYDEMPTNLASVKV